MISKHLGQKRLLPIATISSSLGMDRIFYKSDEVDAYTGHPIYVFDTSYLPSTAEIDYDLFIPTMTKSLPRQPYVLVMFSCGLNKINWIWGVKFLKAFLSPDHENRDNVKNLTKVISVHESWFVKSISQILTNISFSRQTLARLSLLFDSKSSRNNILTSCDSLSELSYYVDITKLKISLNIYKHDANSTLSPKIDFECPINKIITADTRFSRHSDPVFYHHFYQIFRIVDTYGPNVELVFHRPGNRLSTEILVLCITRNQLIWINDWDLNCIASCFKKLLLDVSGPLIPVNKITLPMNDLLNFTLEVLNIMMIDEETNELIFQIMDLCHRIVENSAVTNHTCLSVSKSMCHALTHELLSTQNRDRITVGTRFIKNVITHWRQIRPLYQQRFQTVEQIVNGESLHNSAIDELYNMSHEITMKEDDSGDENESSRDSAHELFDTKAILSDFTDMAEQELDVRQAIPVDATSQRRTHDVPSTRMPNLESLREAIPNTYTSEGARTKSRGAMKEKAIVQKPEVKTNPARKLRVAEKDIVGEDVSVLEAKEEVRGEVQPWEKPKQMVREQFPVEAREEAEKGQSSVEARQEPEKEQASVEANHYPEGRDQRAVEGREKPIPGKRPSSEPETLTKERDGSKIKTTAKPKAKVQLQFPPQKYKFEKQIVVVEKPATEPAVEPKPAFKKPVIRGRKVGQLTKLFEERTQAMEIIRTI